MTFQEIHKGNFKYIKTKSTTLFAGKNVEVEHISFKFCKNWANFNIFKKDFSNKKHLLNYITENNFLFHSYNLGDFNEYIDITKIDEIVNELQLINVLKPEMVTVNKFTKVSELTPPDNVELLVQSPNGINFLTRWRKYYNIFTCQSKTEKSNDWKWKNIGD